MKKFRSDGKSGLDDLAEEGLFVLNEFSSPNHPVFDSDYSFFFGSRVSFEWMSDFNA